jgi:hypothetical protein
MLYAQTFPDLHILGDSMQIRPSLDPKISKVASLYCCESQNKENTARNAKQTKERVKGHIFHCKFYPLKTCKFSLEIDSTDPCFLNLVLKVMVITKMCMLHGMYGAELCQ